MRVRFRYTGHRVREGALQRLFGAGPGTAGGRDLDERARRVANRSRQLVGVDTTALIRSIRIERGPGYRDIVAGRNGVIRYTSVHHDGAGPHVIRPRRAKALRFRVGGRIVYAQKVNHPGHRGTRYLTRALDVA